MTFWFGAFSKKVRLRIWLMYHHQVGGGQKIYQLYMPRYQNRSCSVCFQDVCHFWTVDNIDNRYFLAFIKVIKIKVDQNVFVMNI